MRVFVYYNLHKHTWSVKALEGPDKGRVVHHADTVLLQEAKPKVSQKGRERVLREKRKNVHAGVVGYLCAYGQPLTVPQQSQEVTYNPYKYTTFVNKESGEEWEGSPWALLQDKRVHVL